ncbi:uncharacterized protein ZnT33D [Drosophila montana]|uniref:uncharacterized protein ZnT33D n=1 Tax=Drosophila montana TaxID=40370 RepID=UPI00313C16E9
MSDNKRTTERGGNLPHPSESENESEDEEAMQAALREMVKIPDIEPRQTRTSQREEPRHIVSLMDNLKKNASPETQDKWVKTVSDVGIESAASGLTGDKDVKALRKIRQKTQDDKPKQSEKVRGAPEDTPKQSETWGDRLKKKGAEGTAKRSETWADKVKKSSTELASTNIHKKKDTEVAPKQSETWADKLKKRTPEVPKQFETWGEKLKKKASEATPKQNDTWADRLKASDTSNNVMHPAYVQITSLAELPEQLTAEEQQRLQRIEAASKPKSYLQAKAQNATKSKISAPAELEAVKSVPADQPAEQARQSGSINILTVPIRRALNYEPSNGQPASEDMITPRPQEKTSNFNNIPQFGRDKRDSNGSVAESSAGQQDPANPKDNKTSAAFFANLPSLSRARPAKNEAASTAEAMNPNLAQESATNFTNSDAAQDSVASLIEKASATFQSHITLFGRAVNAVNEARAASAEPAANSSDTPGEAADDTTAPQTAPSGFLGSLPFFGRARPAPNASPAPEETADPMKIPIKESPTDFDTELPLPEPIPTATPASAEVVASSSAIFTNFPLPGRARPAPTEASTTFTNVVGSSTNLDESATAKTAESVAPTSGTGEQSLDGLLTNLPRIGRPRPATNEATASPNQEGNVPEETAPLANPAAATEKTPVEPTATFFSRFPHFGRARPVPSEKPATTRAEPAEIQATAAATGDQVISMDAIAPNLRLEATADDEMTPTTSVPKLITGNQTQQSEDMAEDIQAVGASRSALPIGDNISSSFVRARAPKEAGAALRQVVTASQVTPMPYGAGKTSVRPGFTPATTMPPAEEQGADSARAEIADLPDKHSLTANLLRYLFPVSRDAVTEPRLTKDVVHPLTENSRMPSEVIVVDKDKDMDKAKEEEKKKRASQLERSESMRTLTIIGRHSHIRTTYRDHCHYERHEGVDKRARRKLIVASILCLFFMICEIVGGILSRSLAIATDAAHLLTDLAGFLISLFALYLSGRPSTQRLNFGWYRAEVIGAMLSVYVIWVITGILVWLAVDRLITGQHDVDATIMLATSALAIVVNFIMAIQLGLGHTHTSAQANREPRLHSHISQPTAIEGTSKSQHLIPASISTQCTDLHGENINVRAAFIHVVGDIIQSFGVFVAAIIIFFKPEWAIVDSICTFVFSIIVLVVTLRILRDVMMVLMEATPDYMDYGEVQRTFLSIEGVEHVHNLRIWALSISKIALSAHLAIAKDADPQLILEKATTLIHKRYHFFETTIQIEEYTPGMEDCNQCMNPLSRPAIKEALVEATAMPNGNSKQIDFEDLNRSSKQSDNLDLKRSSKRSDDKDFKRSSKQSDYEDLKSSAQSDNESVKRSSKRSDYEDLKSTTQSDNEDLKRSSKQSDNKDSKRNSKQSGTEDSKRNSKKNGNEDAQRNTKQTGTEDLKGRSKQSGNANSKGSSKQSGNADVNNEEPPSPSQGKRKSGARSST